MPQLPDLGGVDVEVDHLGARRERVELPGHAVVEACADGDDQVGLVQPPVRPLGAVHAGRPVAERVRLGERALGHQGGDDGDAGRLGELAELVAGVAVDRPAADVEDRPRGGEQGSRRLANLSRVDAGRRLPPREIDLMGVSEVDLRLLHVLGDIHEDRARSAGSGDVERRLQNVRELFDVLYEPRVLDDGERDSGRVRLLERVRADQVRAHLAGDADERCRVHPRVGDRRDEVRDARGPDVASATPTLPDARA